MIIDFNRYNGGGGSGSGSTDLTNYWNSAVTEQHIESAASITYASGVSYTDAALGNIDLSAYALSADVESLSAATAGKANAANIQPNIDALRFVGWNNQGVIISQVSKAYDMSFLINGATKKYINTNGSQIPNIYAPVSAGTAGEILVSTGNGAPVWSAVTMGGDSTVLKAVTEFPEDAETGDMVSKLKELPTFSWNTSDNTTAKMHIELPQGTQGQEYDIATFTAADGDALVVLGYWEEEEYPWQVQIYVDGDMVYSWNNYGTGKTYSVELEDGNYASIGFIADDYSGLGGGMLQIGYTNGTFGNWIGGVGNIPDLVLNDVPWESAQDVEYEADGPYYYDGDDWVSVKDSVKEEAEKAAEDKVSVAFPRMPYFNLDGGGNIEAIKSAIFDVDNYDNPESEIWLHNTAFDWLDNNVDWEGDADVLPGFVIDPEEKVAYIENIPAGNYIFALGKGGPGENYDSEFDVGYWSKEDGGWSNYAIESTQDIWDSEDFDIDQYWRDKFEGNVVLTNNGEWSNWSFPKDVKRFEIRIVDDGEGNESLEINTTYDDSLEVLDQVISAALVDLNEKKVESQDIKHIVKLTQAEYDQLATKDPETFYIIITNNN